ncbi:hypothetical protein MMC26_002648 [Xylographa opegraphella]|nr:hypothetical protein [Xylographa opegraphella]
MSHPRTSFLDLPREVRDQCYEHLLTPSHPKTAGKESTFPNIGFAYALPSTIFVLNRQIGHEAGAILYGKNVFSIELHTIQGPGLPPSVQERAERMADAVEALARSPARPLVRRFVLKMAVACYWLEGRKGLDLVVTEDGSRQADGAAMALLTDGPLLESLMLRLRLCDAGAAIPPRGNEVPPCTSELPVYLKRLTQRARNVNIHYEIISPVTRRFFHEENFIQLEQLGQQLHYRAVRRASLLGLPPECRDVIYSYLLCQAEQKAPVVGKWTPASATFPTALLRSCSQIKKEAAPFLYSRIQLSILIGLSSVRMAMARVPPQYRALVRHYDLTVIERYNLLPTYEDVYEVCTELRAGPRIKSVRIHIEVPKRQTPLKRGLDRYAFVDGFAPLADHVDHFIVGIIAATANTPDSSRDEDCYRRLRGVLEGGAKWSYPFREYQFKD